MKSHPTLRRRLLALSLTLAALPTWADDDCDAPLARWQSREAVRQMAARQGWQIQRLKIDDGCYEIRGTDAQGRSFNATIDPETLKVVTMKQRDQRHDKKHDRDGDSEHAAPALRPPQPDNAGATSPLFTPGTAPRGQID
ncbi:MAG: PepSY domain-containing protein [Burkholderiaceae bacterium]